MCAQVKADSSNTEVLTYSKITSKADNTHTHTQNQIASPGGIRHNGADLGVRSEVGGATWEGGVLSLSVGGGTLFIFRQKYPLFFDWRHFRMTQSVFRRVPYIIKTHTHT